MQLTANTTLKLKKSHIKHLDLVTKHSTIAKGYYQSIQMFLQY